MKATRLAIPDVVLLEPRVFGDDRGFFFESYNRQAFKEATGLDPDFVQDNHSRSTQGVLRGLHYQLPPKAQGKLVRVVEAFTRRLIVQEKVTAAIAQCIQQVLEPRGVAVVVEAQHHCLTTRGVHRENVWMTTSEMLGAFRDDDRIRTEFLGAIDRTGR